ncbi:MAG: hypothetical protein CMO01_02945 [Thalassobius sp.]|nr:hypothetical protein [Thalassovita sp.]|tara:strand:+ start:182 stop:463 length:282 start_codon:yes stop_codon:yes gene_type:complete
MNAFLINELQLFLKRPEMYISKREREHVVAFIHGMEIGSQCQFKLTERLSEWMESNHGITNRALGWPYQIEVYAEKKSIDWFDGFKEIVEELL